MRAMAGISEAHDVAAVAHPLDALNINNTVLRFLHQVADCEACWFSAMDELRVARGGHDAQLASCCPMAPPALATCICIFATLASCCCNQHARCMHAGQCKAARTSNRALRAARRGLRGHLNVLERLQSPPREGHLARARRGHPTWLGLLACISASRCAGEGTQAVSASAQDRRRRRPRARRTPTRAPHT